MKLGGCCGCSILSSLAKIGMTPSFKELRRVMVLGSWVDVPMHFVDTVS